MKKLLTLTTLTTLLAFIVLVSVTTLVFSGCFYQRAVEHFSYDHNCDEDDIEVLDTNVKRSGDYYTLEGCGYKAVYRCTRSTCEEAKRIW